MPFELQRLDETVYIIFMNMLRIGLGKENSFNERRKFANTLPPEMKDQLMEKFLSDKSLDEYSRCNCVGMFLDERTKYFDFIQIPKNHLTILHIIGWIPKYSPNIEAINFYGFHIHSQYVFHFENLLKECTNLKRLFVHCFLEDCAIWQLLIVEDFNKHNRDVQIGLEKIEYINIFNQIKPEHCAIFLKCLPNLKNVRSYSSLGKALFQYIVTYQPENKPLNLIEIYDEKTTMSTLQNFASFCPKVRRISLNKPERNVVENLCDLPLLEELHLMDFDTEELFSYLRRMGDNIKTLRLSHREAEYIDKTKLYTLCPILENLTIFNPYCLNDMG